MYGIEKAVRENLYFLVREGQIVAAIKYGNMGPVSSECMGKTFQATTTNT